MKKIIAAAFVLCVALALLGACGSGDVSSSGSAVSGDPGSEYRVLVRDESGAGVAGVLVQFCSDTMCVMGETDDQGIAEFPDQEEGSYTVHVYSVPEGYAEDAAEYEAPAAYGDVLITLTALQEQGQ